MHTHPHTHTHTHTCRTLYWNREEFQSYCPLHLPLSLELLRFLLQLFQPQYFPQLCSHFFFTLILVVITFDSDKLFGLVGLNAEGAKREYQFLFLLF